MNVAAPCTPNPTRAVRHDTLLRAPWSALDDAALLAHLRSDRGIRFEPVIDADEIAPQRVAGILAGRFEFNGETHAMAEPIDWLTNPSRDVEWHILLHKFYYAVGLAQVWQRDSDARAVNRWTQLIDGWIANETPVGFIAADVTGRRVQNWIYSLHALLLNAKSPAPIDAAFLRRLLHSIHAQTEFLCANLTPKRNHRTLELLAICLAGVVFPEFERAAAWRELALRETLANVRADLLPDGVHCELSTDYHHLALRNWLQVRRLAYENGHGVPTEFDRALEAGLEFSLHVHQPSGSMPSFSDGDVRSFLPLLAQGAALFDRGDMQFVATGGAQGTPPRERIAHFPSSGYHVLRSDWRSADAQHLVFDCGPLGEGNHGHFDALSFELAANGRALIVDPGRYTYSEAGEDKNWRVHFRSTAAHNTVCVDGLNQTRYIPKPIKEASRHAHGSVRHKISGPAPETSLVEAFGGRQLDLMRGRCVSHEYDAVHERCIVFVDRRYWIVSDWLRAETEHDYALNFQLGAAAQGQTRLHGEEAFTLLHSPDLVIAQPQRAGQRVQVDGGWVSAIYGYKQAAPALRIHVHARDADFDTVLLPHRDGTPHLRVADVAVHSDCGLRAHALRIETADFVDGWFHARGVSSEQHWRIGDWQFSGQWLHWRQASDGTLIRATSHRGASLRTPDGDVKLATP
jgi:uncharacterized heparinase superfamily protein